MRIVLTGSSSGIGRFLAESLAAKGHEICGLSRSEPDGAGLRCDVSDWDAVIAARRAELMKTDIFTLRRIVAEDRGRKWQP